MTISTTTSTVTYQGNGATTVFTFPFVADSATDLVVTYTDTLGSSTILSPSLYTVAINATPVGGLWGIGGSVTYPNTGSPPVPIAAGTYLSITRAVPYTQDVSIGNQGAFYPQTVEQGLDVLELQIQQIETEVEYSFKAPTTDMTPPNVLPSSGLRANGYFAFDANGQPIISSGSSSGSSPATGVTTRRVATTGTTTINVLTSDAFGGVSVYQSTAPVTTIQLPTTLGPYPIFDGGGNAASFPIRILPPAGKTIQGLAQYYMAFNYQSASFYNDGTSILVL